MSFPKCGLPSLYLYGDIKHLNSFVDFLLTGIWKNFLISPSIDHILEIQRLVVFGVTSFNCDNTKSYLRNNPARNKDNIEVVI